MEATQGTMPTVLCCLCGAAIPPNPASMCIDCIRTQVDITDGIPKQLGLLWCKNCNRYLQPPKSWVHAELESKELLAVCLRRIKGLNKVRLVDAGFVWTEPHSRRVKLKLTIQKEVFSGTILQQAFVVEFIVEGQQCEACQRVFANDSWKAVVQLRQKVDHKKTFLYIEQLILAHGAHQDTINIKEMHEGIDFYYAHRNAAVKMLTFLQGTCPVRYKTSERLISTDINSNTANFKFTFSVEIAPICREDFICLPPKLAQQLSMIGTFALCHRISDSLHLINPFTAQTAVLSSVDYWRTPFSPFCSAARLIEYTVLDSELTGDRVGRHAVADVQVARSRDLGANDQTYHVRTHLGHLLEAGDTVLGYDITTMVFNDALIAAYNGRLEMPDVVLVRKTYPSRKKGRARVFRLKRLEMEMEAEGNVSAKRQAAMRERHETDFEEFQDDLEDDAEMRKYIRLYRNEDVIARMGGGSGGGGGGGGGDSPKPRPAAPAPMDPMAELRAKMAKRQMAG
eukprot:Rmarinus@m.9657